MKMCKRIIAMFMVFALAFQIWGPGLPAYAENSTSQQISHVIEEQAEIQIYSNEMVSVYAQNSPVSESDAEETEQSGAKKLTIQVSCNGENIEQNTLLYVADPGTLSIEVNEAYTLDTVLVDGAQYTEGTAISFDENTQERTVAINVLKKEISELQDNSATNIDETVPGPTEEQAEIQIYSNEMVSVYAQNSPVSESEVEKTEQSGAKKLTIQVSCNGENIEQNTLLYVADPGTLSIEVNEAYTLDTVLVDGAQYTEGTAISFDENTQERTVAINVLKKEMSETQDNPATNTDETVPDPTEEQAKIQIYSNEMVSVYAQNSPVSESEVEETEQSGAKKLTIQVSCNGENTEQDTLLYVAGPGTLSIEVNEAYTLDTVLVDGAQYTEGTAISFDENTQERTVAINVLKKEVSEVQDNPAANINETVSGPTEEQKEETQLTASYSTEKPFSIQQGDNPTLFEVTTSPVPQGKLVIKLPPFFELTVTPTATENYTVKTSKETFDSSDLEWGSVLEGVERQVIELTYKEVDSNVYATFEMKMTYSSRTALTEAMIRAGENPDTIPLNLETYLYDADGELLKQDIVENTSELTDPQTMKMGDTAIDEFNETDSTLKYENVDVAKKNMNVLYQENKNDYLLRISGYHYPYTNVELLVPKDNGNKLITFNTAEKYNRYSWNGEAKEEVIKGQTYLVRSMDDRNVELSSGYVGPIFRSYNSNGSSVASPMTYIRLEFSNDIEIGNTVSFTSPVLLRYTYKGKTITKELYTLSNYTFQGPVDLRLSLDDNRTVLCGAEFTNGSNRVMNYDEAYTVNTGNNPNRKLPIKRENITYTIEYPFETQPKQITTLKTDTLSNFTIVYTVKSEDGTKDVTVENASTGYEFQLSEGERVSKIVIQIPCLDEKEDLTFSVKMQSMETQENGAAILNDKTVYLTHTLAVAGGKPITEKSKVNLKARKDLMNSDGRTYEVFLDGTGGSSWTGGMMQIDSRADEHNEYSVTYQNAEFVLNTDPQVMSKITGYWFDFNKAMDEPVTIWYKTNYSQTEWKQISQNNPAATEYYVYLPLESGEYVTKIKLNFGDLSPKEIETPYSYAISFAPILNSKRTYYDSNGQEQSIGFNTTFTMKYILRTDNIQSPVVNEETNKVPGTTYLSNVEFPLTPYYSQYASWSSSQPTAYRGSTVEFTINKLVRGGEEYYPGYFGDSDHYYKIDSSLRFTNQYLYIEVDKGFEISSLNISNVFLARENLSNGNRLFVYKITDKTTLAVQDLRVKLYIRPDAETGNTVNPFKSIAISYDQYLKDYFPAYPDVEEQKNQYPYHYVTLRNEKNYNNKDYNQFPGEWNVSDEIQKDGFCYPFSEKKFQINEVSTAVTTLFPTLQEGLRDNPLVFKEAQREQLGYVAFIGASSETTVNDYTTTFELPRSGEIQTIDEQTYTSQYALFAAGELEIYLNNRPVDLTAEGITVTYYDGNGQELDVSSFSVQDAKKVEISFDQLVSGNVYELRMPLRADSRTGNDVSAWNAYVINSNHTGDQSINYLPPLTYRYDSYRLIGQFGLDKKEDGTGSVLNETHTLYIFDASWNVVYQQNLTSADSYSYDVQFNSVDSETFYIGFGIDQEKMEEYYPTLHRTISDLPDSEQNIKSLEDGTKFWYLKIEEADLINSTGANKYDALFVHLPTIDAKDLTVMVDETKNLGYEITQTVNPDMVGQYTVRATLNNGASSEVIATLDGTTVTGKMEGTVEYQITVTNKQGKTVSDNAMIKVVPRSGVLQIQKEVEPATASGQFSFRIESEGSPKQVWYMHVQGAGFATLDGKTNELILPAGQYTITELDGLNFDLNQTTAKINDLDQGNKRAVTVEITGAEKTRVCFANKVTSSNIPNDSSAVVNGMKQAVITDDYTLYFEQKKELGEDTPSNTTSN